MEGNYVMMRMKMGIGITQDVWLTTPLLCRIEDVNKHCLAEFRKHWQCLDNNNQQLWQCRPAEWKLNKCVFDNLVRTLVAAELMK